MNRTILTSGLAILALLSLSVSTHAQHMIWLPENDETEAPRESADDYQDIHASFRGQFTLATEGETEFHLSGASWYRVWLDGVELTEGPDRYAPEYPLYQVRKTRLEAGEHLLAVQLHSEGVDTRMLQGIDPFLYCRILLGDQEVPVEWKSMELKGYARQLRRVSAQFGWLEWADTRQQPDGWTAPGFDDTKWEAPARVSRDLGSFSPSQISPVTKHEIPFTEMASGPLASYYGYETDNPSARFFLRDLECAINPPQGAWKRYDLGRVRLIYPSFTLDLPEGAVVEFAFSEELKHGRVSPWINLSVSDSYNMVHFKARGGIQEFHPMTPKGGRYVEMHVIAPPDSIAIVKERFIERAYHTGTGTYPDISDSLIRV
ncbi:MAG: hypothetical protein ABFS10_06870 [Bacteroidota bacterium]